MVGPHHVVRRDVRELSRTESDTAVVGCCILILSEKMSQIGTPGGRRSARGNGDDNEGAA